VTRKGRDWLIGSAILLILVGWVHWAVGWGRLLAPWREIPLLHLAGLVALGGLSYLCRGVRLYVYFPQLLRGQLPATLRLSILHNVANNLLPMRSGEAAFPLLMKRYFGHGYADSAFALVWIRLLDLHVIGLVAVAAAWLARPHPLWWVAAGFWLFALPLTYRLRGALRRRLSGRPGRWAGWAARALAAMPADATQLGLVYLWTLLSWGAKFIAFTVILRQFLDLALWQACAGVIGAELSSVLPFHGVAGSGSYELAMLAALAPTGVAPAAALQGAINLHLFLLGVTLLLLPVALALPRRRLAGQYPASSR
jgi:uncharacterized membrane protein YbhN (UPF0104 family)